MVVTRLLVSGEDSWIMDLGDLVHICNNVQGFHQTKSMNKGEAHIYMGSHMKASVRVVGDIIIKIPRGHLLVMRDVFYSQEFRQNIISMSRVVPSRYEFNFGSQLLIYFKKSVIGSGTLVNGLYVLNVLERRHPFVQNLLRLSVHKGRPRKV